MIVPPATSPPPAVAVGQLRVLLVDDHPIVRRGIAADWIAFEYGPP